MKPHIKKLCIFILLLQAGFVSAQSGRYTTIRIVDSKTNRGVPLVELKTVNERVYYTDSNGVIAFFEPGLMDQEVFFHIKSHGYEYPQDGFGYRGTKVQTRPGSTVTLKIDRINIAERLYRITGQGIYGDSKLVNIPFPIKDDVPGNVLGCDSVLCESFGDYIYWFWGDTNRIKYPLGNFHVSGARSRRINTGGLDPDKGVEFEYFTRSDGFAKETARLAGEGLTWLDCLMKTREDDGSNRLFAVFMKVKAPLNVYQRGIAEFSFDKQVWFERMKFPVSQQVIPKGHALRYQDPNNETEYFYFAGGMPFVRVPAKAEAILTARQYQAYTPLSRTTGNSYRAVRDANGGLTYRWTNIAPVMTDEIASKLIANKEIQEYEADNSLVDFETGKIIRTQHGSVYYNQLKGRYVLLISQIGGSSLLGEIWYAEAPAPIGPWKYARKIVTHNDYSFYNPKQHPLFNKDGGRTIYFEGTYTNMFSGNKNPTPGYNYNQVMYKVDVQDSRLNLPLPVTLARNTSQGTFRWTVGRLRDGDVGIPEFYALEHQAERTREISLDSEKVWIATEAGPNRIGLYEWTNQSGNTIVRIEGAVVGSDYKRSQFKLGYAWKK
ncbi:MAG: hypothetical protein CMJ76_03240 [Planctomycetaceae bacterium]|nr:hypothetical protein [Planctomycetaceae bacterium]|tara:strand:+ start:401 stop:2218 length:1818 start_codon:yes stop_codon:yes gene_type:complete